MFLVFGPSVVWTNKRKKIPFLFLYPDVQICLRAGQPGSGFTSDEESWGKKKQRKVCEVPGSLGLSYL